eukprot:Sspe_Gene.82002::Locus_53456_Transcript_1_1_Confidence_1.000_Length_1006::g.82002::m.82002/K07305/msrB; peptide-methionine (R)-S-oxide reductase
MRAHEAAILLLLVAAGDAEVQEPSCRLQGNVDFGMQEIAPRLEWVCCGNRHYAEPVGLHMHSRINLFHQIEHLPRPVVFYDATCGIPLFAAPVNRTFEEWKMESIAHGWPSFRNDEVLWGNVIRDPDGEVRSRCGAHLGHDIPDEEGSRHCINLICIAGLSPLPRHQVDKDVDFGMLSKWRSFTPSPTPTPPLQVTSFGVGLWVLVLVVGVGAAACILQTRRSYRDGRWSL